MGSHYVLLITLINMPPADIPQRLQNTEDDLDIPFQSVADVEDDDPEVSEGWEDVMFEVFTDMETEYYIVNDDTSESESDVILYNEFSDDQTDDESDDQADEISTTPLLPGGRAVGRKLFDKESSSDEDDDWTTNHQSPIIQTAFLKATILIFRYYHLSEFTVNYKIDHLDIPTIKNLTSHPHHHHNPPLAPPQTTNIKARSKQTWISLPN